MFKLSIPAPCHEDWNEMDANEHGRHCNSCQKTVIDFTGMSDDEVRMFFLNKKGERVCGRLEQKQMQRIVIDLPLNIFGIRMPIWKQFLLACLLAFSMTLFSCETRFFGNEAPAGMTEDTLLKSYTTGLLALKPDTIPVPVQSDDTGFILPVITYETTEIISGDIEVTPLYPPSMDTVLIEGPVKKIQTDSLEKILKKKDQPKTDTQDCNTKTYY